MSTYSNLNASLGFFFLFLQDKTQRSVKVQISATVESHACKMYFLTPRQGV
ncbi:hypothetical protein HanRHA438_Chr09g0407451 [Helianthus annuus]|nr:hypothetical protein HanRHA438_Chr09g0407451 [Helianthus annuus]